MSVRHMSENVQCLMAISIPGSNIVDSSQLGEYFILTFNSSSKKLFEILKKNS